MTLTITIEGKGVIANADALIDDTGGTGTGDWGEDGGGSIDLTNDTFLFGSSCIAGAYSNKSGFQYFDLGATYELDFDVAGAEEGQHIYMWVHCPTIGLMETIANKGLAIRLGTSLTDYREFIIAGSNDANGWNGGWRCFVIDPTKTGSVSDTGSYDVGSIRYIGVWADAAGLARGDNLFIDQIAVGFGLRITGTSTNGWEEAVDYCIDYPNRAWGMLQEREGVFYAYGKFWIGDSTQTAAVSFADAGRVIQFGISEYWNGSAWVTLADIDYQGVVIEDAATYPTTFQDGILVGTVQGRSGNSYIGNANHDVSLDLYGGGEATSLTKLLGSLFRNLQGAINFGDDADHQMFSVSWANCSQVDPVGAIKIRNCLFSEYTPDTDAALLWNANIDIEDCSFVASTDVTNDPHAIEHPASGSVDYLGLSFSGNDYDINFSAGSGTLTVNATGSNPTTYEITGGGSAVDIINTVVLKVTVKDRDRVAIENAQTSIKLLASPYTQLMNEDTLSSGIAQENYNYGTDVDVVVLVRKSDDLDVPRYKAYSSIQTVKDTGLDLNVELLEKQV